MKLRFQTFNPGTIQFPLNVETRQYTINVPTKMLLFYIYLLIAGFEIYWKPIVLNTRTNKV